MILALWTLTCLGPHAHSGRHLRKPLLTGRQNIHCGDGLFRKLSAASAASGLHAHPTGADPVHAVLQTACCAYSASCRPLSIRMAACNNNMLWQSPCSWLRRRSASKVNGSMNKTGVMQQAERPPTRKAVICSAMHSWRRCSNLHFRNAEC